MPDCFTDDADFETWLEQATKNDPAAVTKFIAREAHATGRRCLEHGQRLRKLEIAAIIFALILVGSGLVDWLTAGKILIP